MNWKEKVYEQAFEKELEKIAASLKMPKLKQLASSLKGSFLKSNVGKFLKKHEKVTIPMAVSGAQDIVVGGTAGVIGSRLASKKNKK